jgi:hypothetical protein
MQTVLSSNMLVHVRSIFRRIIEEGLYVFHNCIHFWEYILYVPLGFVKFQIKIQDTSATYVFLQLTYAPLFKTKQHV